MAGKSPGLPRPKEPTLRICGDSTSIAKGEPSFGREFVERPEEIAMGDQVAMAGGDGSIGIVIGCEGQDLRKRPVMRREHVEENDGFEAQHETTSIGSRGLDRSTIRMRPAVPTRLGTESSRFDEIAGI
jgi:hypothetical protein